MLTSAEVCAQLRIDPKTLRKWIKSGDIRAMKATPAHNAGWRIREEDLAEFIERQVARATA